MSHSQQQKDMGLHKALLKHNAQRHSPAAGSALKHHDASTANITSHPRPTTEEEHRDRRDRRGPDNQLEERGHQCMEGTENYREPPTMMELTTTYANASKYDVVSTVAEFARLIYYAENGCSSTDSEEEKAAVEAVAQALQEKQGDLQDHDEDGNEKNFVTYIHEKWSGDQMRELLVEAYRDLAGCIVYDDDSGCPLVKTGAKMPMPMSVWWKESKDAFDKEQS